MAALLIILIGVLGLIKQTGSQGSVPVYTPKDCTRVQDESSSTPGRYKLVCELRTINSEFDKTNFSVIPSLGTVSLTILCAESIPSESRLLNGSFEHLHELEELNIEHCKLIEIPPGGFSGLPVLRNLSILTHPYETDLNLSFSPLSLTSVPNLNRLDLSSSGVWNLPDLELCTLSSLNHLNLSNNRIADIADLGVSRSHCPLSLSSLDLSGNQLRSLNTGSLESFVQLKSLDLSTNIISQIAEGSLRGLASLVSLDLSGNSVDTLPSTLFQDTPELRQLKLINNRLSILSSRIFAPIPNLVILDLSRNEFSTPCLTCPAPPCQTCLSDRTFAGLEKLVLLNLAENRIQYLNTNLFQELGSLQILDLSRNLVETIPEDSFRGLVNLHTLKLSRNRIDSVDFNSFRGFSALNTLSLENNSVVEIHPQAFSNLTLLQDLNLYSNQLKTIPSALSSLISLKTVDLGKNGIVEVDTSPLVHLSSLIGLKLDENDISLISEGSFANLTNLQILNLAGNRISGVERGSFNQNRKLQAVRLDSNLIPDIVGLFGDLPNLRWLNISENRIQKFDYFLLPPSLTWLDIHKNEIEDIGNYFDKESELNILTLDISFNKLKTISAKSIPDRVQLLSLNDNLITRVDPHTFKNKTRLVRVDLYANQIVKLETSSVGLSEPRLGETATRPEFYLGGNPFLCDCNLEWLKTINGVRRGARYPFVKDLESIYCKLMYSQENAYIPLVEAKPSDFLCPYTAHCFPLCHCCDFDACDCEMTCPENCTCYHDQPWSTNIVDCASSEFIEPPTAIPMDATEVYLHGNNFQLLSSHSFIGRKKLRVLFLNNSNIEAVLNYTFYGLRRLEALHLDHNNIQRLEGYEFQTLRGLKSLYLDHNRISWIEESTFTHLESLETLTLDNNQLYNFPGHFSLDKNTFLIELSLASNPWSCDCNLVTQFNIWLEENKARTTDLSQIACFPNNSNTPGRYIMQSLECSFTDSITLLQPGVLTDHLPLIIVGFSILTVLCVGFGVVIYYRTELRVWVFTQWGLRLCYSRPSGDEDTEKMYDAYITYSIKDENFVSQVLSPELEHGEPSHRLCLHYRDFPHNSYVADSIIEAVSSSRRTVLVLSKHFLVHEWCRYDIKSALHDVLKSRGKCIIIFLGEIPSRSLDPDMRLILKSNPTIHWSDRMFWEKLRFYLPPGSARALQHYSLPIYEVPHLPAHLNLSHHTGHNKIYEQRTLESQLTPKLY